MRRVEGGGGVVAIVNNDAEHGLIQVQCGCGHAQ